GGTADIDGGIGVTNLTCATDAYLIKYSKSTGALQWGFNLGGNSLENGTHLLVTPEDEIVLAGTMSSPTFDADPGFASFALNSNGISSAPFVIRYLPSGQLVSGFVLGGSAGTTIALGALQVSMNNNLIVAGNFTGTLNWLDVNGQSSAFTSGDSSDAFIAELDGVNQYLQIKRITGSGNQTLSDVLVKGPVMYACGQLDGPTLPEQDNATVLEPSNSSNQAYLFRYNDNPTSISRNLNAVNEVLVYPNPALHLVHVVVDDLIGVELYSYDGRLVLQSANQSFIVSDLPSGVYLLRCKTSKGERRTRLVIGN
ncbi:MAG: T9SS type A sorting domain-containing protein, partial [Bacteroidia bacterium]